jgi:hypothetical protein
VIDSVQPEDAGQHITCLASGPYEADLGVARLAAKTVFIDVYSALIGS